MYYFDKEFRMLVFCQFGILLPLTKKGFMFENSRERCLGGKKSLAQHLLLEPGVGC